MSTLPVNPVPLPLSDKIVRLKDRKRYGPNETDPNEGIISTVWADSLVAQSNIQAAASVRLTSAEVNDQAASIAATDISGGDLSAGFYELLVYPTISQGAGTSSSLTVTLDWQDRSLTKSYSLPAITGNTTGTTGPAVIPIRIDSASPVRYSTTYVSVGAPVMKYDLEVVLRRVDA